MDIILKHNFDGQKFMWLYAKYSFGANPEYHCTNAIRGRYSKKFNRNNPDFCTNREMVLDEFKEIGWDAIYICGVSKIGYARHMNYDHNVHVAIVPKPGEHDEWTFENWKMSVENGKFEHVIPQSELDKKYDSFPEKYTTCRMFRWAVTHYGKQLENK